MHLGFAASLLELFLFNEGGMFQIISNNVSKFLQLVTFPSKIKMYLIQNATLAQLLLKIFLFMFPLIFN